MQRSEKEIKKGMDDVFSKLGNFFKNLNVCKRFVVVNEVKIPAKFMRGNSAAKKMKRDEANIKKDIEDNILKLEELLEEYYDYKRDVSFLIVERYLNSFKGCLDIKMKKKKNDYKS